MSLTLLGYLLTYVGAGIYLTTVSIQRFFDRLQREYPTHPRHTIGGSEILLYVITVPLWPLVLGGVSIINRWVDEPIGTRRKV